MLKLGGSAPWSAIVTQYLETRFFPEMSQVDFPNPPKASRDVQADDSSFGDILSEFEHSHKAGGETLEGTVVSVTPDGIFVDIGRKMDGILPADPTGKIPVGAKVIVSIRGRDSQGL